MTGSTTTTRRRRGAVAAIALFAMLAASCSADDDTAATPEPAAPEDDQAETEDTPEDGEFDWRRFEGTEIRLVANQNPWHEHIAPLVPQFEELTGITVNLEALPEEQFRQRIQTELVAQSTDIDLFMSALFQDGPQFTLNGWYEDLSPYPNDSTLTSPDYLFENIGAGTIESHTINGTLIGIPILSDTEMMYYRKDVLADAGVDVPSTMEEFEAVVAAIDDPGSGIRGWGSRGRGAAAVTQLSVFLYNHGADWIDDDGYAAFNTPEGVAAFEMYGRLLSDHGPTGVAGMSWEELMPLFQQRQVAFWNDSSGFVGSLLDPEQSEDVDNIGFAPMPAGPVAETNSIFPWALSMSSLSTNKDAAWYFIQWATSQEVVETLQGEGVTGARTDISFPDTFPAEWVEVHEYNLTIARPKLPLVVPVGEVRDIIGEAIVDVIQGGDAASAVERAAEGFDRAIDAAG